jgi:hypothetical protein
MPAAALDASAPGTLFSSTMTERPAWASFHAHEDPMTPPPMTTTSARTMRFARWGEGRRVTHGDAIIDSTELFEQSRCPPPDEGRRCGPRQALHRDAGFVFSSVGDPELRACQLCGVAGLHVRTRAEILQRLIGSKPVAGGERARDLRPWAVRR